MTPQQLLRRADWRFLLPEPKPGKTAVFVDGLLGEAVRAVATHSVDGRSPEAFGCRLAVLADPQPAEVSAAFSALEPGATCYSEWSAWRAGGPSGVRSRLECAGFADVRLYWPVPGLASCRAWFEARPDAGYRRAVDDVLTSSTSRRSARLVLPLIANAILRFRLMPSLCAVAHRPNHADPMPGTPTVDFPDVVLSLVSQAEGVDPDDSLLVTRAGGMVIDSKVNWPIYAGAATDVRWIAKAPRTECSAARLACERDALALLGDRPDADGLLVPRLVFWGDVEGVPLLVQTALIGQSLTDRVHRVGFDEVAEDGTNALIALARHAKVEPRGHWWGEIMEPQLVKLERVLDPLGERDLAVAVREALAPLGDLPMVVAHNDCTPWNAAIAGHRMGLFDWEEFEPSGLPLADLLFLLANIAFIIDGTEGRTDAVGTYEGLIGGSDARAAVFGRCVRRYAESVGVGPADIAPLRLATWVRHTAWDIENLLADTDGPLTGILSRSSCVPILRAELARSSRRPEAPGDRF